MPIAVRGRLFSDVTAARAALATVDAVVAVPAITNPDGSTAVAATTRDPVYLVLLEEGAGGRDYRIATPGNAAARIRARGVAVERPLVILQRRDGAQWLVPEPVGRTLPGAAVHRGSYDDATEVERVRAEVRGRG